MTTEKTLKDLAAVAWRAYSDGDPCSRDSREEVFMAGFEAAAPSTASPLPTIAKWEEYTVVLILQRGEVAYAEALFGRDGLFRFGYDEAPITDVEHWMEMPRRGRWLSLKEAAWGYRAIAAECIVPLTRGDMLVERKTLQAVYDLAEASSRVLTAAIEPAGVAETNQPHITAHTSPSEISKEKLLEEFVFDADIKGMSLNAAAGKLYVKLFGEKALLEKRLTEIKTAGVGVETPSPQTHLVGIKEWDHKDRTAIKKGEARSYKGRQFIARHNIPADTDTNAPGYSEFWAEDRDND